MSPLLVAAMLFPAGAPQEMAGRETTFTEPDGSQTIYMWENLRRLNPPKLSPKTFGEEKQQWMFEWITSGYGKENRALEQFNLRFRVFNQERRTENDHAPRVTRTLLRLWQFNVDRLSIDHSPAFNNRIVDVYICWGGKAGGEQLFDEDRQSTSPVKVNTIYIYDLNSFTDPVEMLREVAHEYGHATLPAVGGYTAPEDWANGYLGERIFLRWLRDDMATKRLVPVDAMGATQAQITAWLDKNVEPGVRRVATQGPNATLIARNTAAAMDEYLSVASYAQVLLPVNVFARSLKLTGSTDAKDYLRALVLASEEPDRYPVNLPVGVRGGAFWLPSGNAKVTGAKELSRRGSWVKFWHTGGPVTVTNRTAEADGASPRS